MPISLITLRAKTWLACFLALIVSINVKAATVVDPCEVIWPSAVDSSGLTADFASLRYELKEYAAGDIPFKVYDSLYSDCPVYFTPIPPTLDNFPRVAGVTLYQAYQSITFESGFTSEDGAVFVAEIVTNGSQVPQASNLTGSPNTNMNWVQASSFDETGTLIADGKQFYDDGGRLMQTQSKVFYRAGANTVYTHVFASQPIRDAYGRDALTTMSAPIDYADFSYQPNFALHNSTGSNYTHLNFDVANTTNGATDKTLSPDQLWDPTTGNPVQGTLAWYYSTSNTWEPYTPVTSYPYSRQTYYQDGTGNTKKAAGAGESFVMGSGHEGSSYVTPVANELDFYLQVRNKFFATTDLGGLPGSLVNQAIQQISHDANGLEWVTIQDRSGNTLMTARAGTDQVVNNTVTVGAAGTSDMNIYYFKLLSGGAVGITGGTYSLEDMNTELATSLSGTGTLPAGYYKLVNTGTTALTLTYSNGYTEVTYNFYNQLGQLVSSVSPEGVKKLYGVNQAGLGSYSTKTSIPFVSLFTYDEQGRLISQQNPDQNPGGVAQQFIYRNDGKIRFSQNAVQAQVGSYNYTNYDGVGRPIESGQYQPDASGIVFGSAAMTGILENTSAGGGLTTGTKTDVSMIQYDLPDNGFSQYVPSTPNVYSQDPFNLAGAMSLIQKYSIIVNNAPSPTNIQSATWYNYDEEGKVVWVIKYINGLGYKTMNYSYDALGNLIKKVYQAGTPAETFVHYFDYDPVSKQIMDVYTNTADNPNRAGQMLQATYYYYLQGGLKRIELGSNLQGIDYTYTLKGALKAINNSNKTQDPGNDGNNAFAADAFGEVLDYYTGDYANGRSGVATINGVNASSVTADSYVGNIKAMTWYSEKPTSTGLPDAPSTYVYQYDPKYQFTESTWGTGINFGTTPAGFTATGFNKEKVGSSTGTIVPPYDENGNIQYLQRTEGTGTFKDQFTYNYTSNTNQLTSVTNNVSGTAQTYATYSYDLNGQVTSEAIGDGSAPAKYMVYDVTGKVTAVYQDAGHTQQIVGFVYDETGQCIKKMSYNGSYQLYKVTYYVGDVIYTQQVTAGGTTYGNAVVQEYQITGGSGRLGVYYPQGPIYAYELSDHLGNVRAVIAQNGSTYQVRMYTDYYPFGMVINSGGTNDYRYDYQGQYSEKDQETGWNNFELRMYDSRIARWLQYDPKGQFNSPYIGMGNDPVAGTDPDGGFDWMKGADGDYSFDPNVHSQKDIDDNPFLKGQYSYAGVSVSDADYMGKNEWFVGLPDSHYSIYDNDGRNLIASGQAMMDPVVVTPTKKQISIPPPSAITTAPKSSSLSYYEKALQFHDVPYTHDFISPKGFDCSGLVCLVTGHPGKTHVWSTQGNDPPPGNWTRIYPSTASYDKFLKGLSVGDLFVWRYHHTAFYAGNQQMYGAHDFGTPSGMSNTTALKGYHIKNNGYPEVWRQK